MDLTPVKTSVEWKTSDSFLANLYEAADTMLQGNVIDFCGRPVLIEGGGYNSIWIETQPMGGEMYAKRNLSAAINNSLLFIEHQQENGRYPYRISVIDDKLAPAFLQLQGLCLPHHALNLYYWCKKQNPDFLRQLYKSVKAWDDYIWKYRNSDGCLESWCVLDTGEDFANRFAESTEASWHWPGETPPQNDLIFPVKSMDVMAYSYDARIILAKISALLDNGKQYEWEEKAKQVRDKMRSYLWDEKRGACFDRDKHNKTMPALVHNNLRVMYYGAFSQDMADRFVNEHLLNPDEFFTPMPLPSVAVNDPVFRNIAENNWSGQPEGLTYQRVIRALENYGYYSEITLFGKKLIDCVGKHNTFPQQFDPFTGEFSEAGRRTTYGPTALSVLEFISRFYGVHVQFDEIYWGALGIRNEYHSYTQYWDNDAYTVEKKAFGITGSINKHEIFRVPGGLRIVSDWEGNVKAVINISGAPFKSGCKINGKKGIIELGVNEVKYFQGNE